jgi:hypothetical protein
MGAPLFLGQRLKIDRAKEHIGALHDRIDNFLQTRRYGVTYQTHGQQEVSVFIDPAVMPRIKEHAELDAGILVGDIVHNLRSVLDQTVWELGELNPPSVPPRVRRNRRDPFSRIWFPIVQTKGEWKTAIQEQLWRIPAEVLPVIEQCQPLDSGYGVPITNRATNDALRALNRLSNLDKHRTIPVPITSVRFIGGLDRLSSRFRAKFLRGEARTFEAEAELLCFSVAEHGIRDARALFSEMDMHFQYAFEMAFDQTVKWLEGREVEEALKAIYKTVDAVFGNLVNAVALHRLALPDREVYTHRSFPPLV